jgi:peptidyl-prolyl cis-trans isomerase A (cyclophilin A)
MALPMALGLCLALAASADPSEPRPAPAAPDDFTPAPDLPQGWYARIETSLGRIVARLLPEQAPQSVAHFAALAEGRLEWLDVISGQSYKEPFYDGVRVHRTEPGWMFEAGDRYGTGDGAPSIYVPPEGLGPIDFSQPGRLGMTRGSRGSPSGVVFFATAASLPWFNGSHPCFGTIVSGREVVRAISEATAQPGQTPIEPPVIEKVRIFAVDGPAPLPEPVPYTPTLKRLFRKKDPPEPR